jgi:hypothetical protein
MIYFHSIFLGSQFDRVSSIEKKLVHIEFPID